MSELELNGAPVEWAEVLTNMLTVPGRLGEQYSRFYQYSMGNIALLYMQWQPEPMATYKRWEELDRQVLKGSRAKAILRPIAVKREDADGEQHTFTRFKLVRCLFGLSETEGEPLPEYEPPEWSTERALEALDVKQVPFDMFDGNCQGYSVGREFAINPVASSPFKTTLHELGHIVLGHTSREQLPEYKEHRGVKEFQAESTAFLTGNELEALSEDEASESRGYVQHWLRRDRPEDKAIKQVFAATTAILKAGRE